MRLETKFQDKDFDFGEIVKAKVTTYYDENKIVVMADIARGGISRFEYDSIKDFTDHWEDAPEEPKEYWYLENNGGIYNVTYDGDEYEEEMKSIGNYFETKEEAEKAVEKLKAWKRLEGKGFEFDGWTIDDGLRISICTNADSDGIYDDDKKEIKSDLDLLFGGEG